MPKFIFLLLLFPLFGSVVRSLSIWDSDSPPQLYSDDDIGIISTNITNFEQNLYNKDKVTMVQFYNSWCGHCRRFAPVFKEFAKSIANWSPVVQLLAINCVDEQNEEVCRNYTITSYPTLRLFWINVNNSEDHGMHVENLEHNVEFLRNQTIYFISSNLSNANKSVPKSWPNLKKTVVNDPLDLLHIPVNKQLASSPANIPVVAIVEKNDSYVGQQIILELSTYKDKIKILSLDIATQNSSNFDVDISAKTVLLQIKPDLTFRVLASLPLSEKNQTPYYLNFINQNLFNNKLLQLNNLSKQPDNLEDDNSSSNQRSSVQPEDVPLNIGDLYGAVSYTLFHQIPLKKSLSGQQLNILRRLFDVIERYFPADDQKFIEFIHGLNQFLKSNEQGLEISEFLNYLKKNGYDFKSKFPGWTTCKGSQATYRGYTCSLWSLFHTLTLNEYMKEKESQKWVNLHEVLFTMRDYIANFFSCSDCANHFARMSADLENELKYPNSSVLWLWSRHNRVNQRLKGDLTEDPEHPKAIYPYQKDCPSCYSPAGELIDNEVMRYLIDRYYQVKANDSNQMKKQPKNEKLGILSVPETFKDNRVFSYTDYSLIFAMYALIAVIVMSVFFYLPIRIKRKAKAKQMANSKYMDA